MNFKGFSNAGSSDNQASKGGGRMYFWIGVFVAALVFFCLGIFVGSAFAAHDANTSSTNGDEASARIGLPGTMNKVEKWVDGAPSVGTSSSKSSHLRGEPAAQQNLPIKPINAGELAHYLANSFHVGTESYMTGPSNLDHERIFIGAWIYLDDLGGQDNDMRTVFSNKGSGCTSGDGQHGISLYINAWQTHDQKLYVEYGGERSGCNKLDSGDKLLRPGQWYHAGVYLGDSDVSLFIDGVEVAHSDRMEGHLVQEHKPLSVGFYDGHQYPLFGSRNLMWAT
jgi:hypothetical protein